MLLDAYYNEEMTLDELEQELTGAQYGRYKKQIDTITSKILERHADIWRQDMLKNNRRVKVIWIYGAAGTGKTSLARSRTGGHITFQVPAGMYFRVITENIF